MTAEIKYPINGDNRPEENRRANNDLLFALEIDRSRQALADSIGCRYAGCTIDNYDLHAQSEIKAKQKTILAALMQYRNEIREHLVIGTNIAFIGTVGTGKDHLMSAMLMSAVNERLSVAWSNGTTLYQQFRESIESGEPESRIIKRQIDVDICAISDILPPQGSLTAFQRERLFAIVDSRYRRRKPIWWSMNAHSPEEAAERLSSQILDRLMDDAMILKFDWESYRKGRRWQREK